MTVPAKTVVTLVGTTPHLPAGCEVVVEPTNLPFIPEGLKICPTLTKIRNSVIPGDESLTESSNFPSYSQDC